MAFGAHEHSHEEGHDDHAEEEHEEEHKPNAQISSLILVGGFMLFFLIEKFL
jgi:hypothetical protein